LFLYIHNLTNTTIYENKLGLSILNGHGGKEQQREGKGLDPNVHGSNGEYQLFLFRSPSAFIIVYLCRHGDFGKTE
jgi:hypothetical protein